MYFKQYITQVFLHLGDLFSGLNVQVVDQVVAKVFQAVDTNYIDADYTEQFIYTVYASLQRSAYVVFFLTPPELQSLGIVIKYLT